jgi:type II secretory pathway predicted ATPase ExeA
VTRALWDAHASHDRRPLIVIDEAHLLSPAMLEEIRFLCSHRR